MKKFGTPIAAAPGSASEKVGSARPSARRRRRRPGPARPRLAFLACRPWPRRRPCGARRRAPWPGRGRPPRRPAARPGRPGARPWAWPRCPAPSCGVEAWRRLRRWAAGAWAGVVAEGCVAVGAGVCAGAEAGPTSVALTIAPGDDLGERLAVGDGDADDLAGGQLHVEDAIGRRGQHGAAEAGQEDASRRQADEQLALLHAWVQSSPAARPEGNAVPVGADEPSTASPRCAQDVLPAWDAVQRRAVSRGRAGMATWAFGPSIGGSATELERGAADLGAWSRGRGAAPRRSLTLKSKVRYVPHRPRARSWPQIGAARRARPSGGRYRPGP